MAKKIILIVGTFLILLGGLLVYHEISGTPWFSASPQARPADKKHEAIRGHVAGPGDIRMGFSPGKDAVVYQVAPDGRRAGRYAAEMWQIVGKETHLTKPRIELYPKGQVIYISADEGTIIANQSAADGTLIANQGSSTGSVRRGSLRGHVCVSIDRAPDTNGLKAPREQRLDDFIDVYTDQVNFDNDLLEITAPGKVDVYSEEANIFGQGLTVRWNTGPREISRLLLAKGEKLEIFREMGDMGLDLPGAEATAQPTANLVTRPTTSSAPTTTSSPTTTTSAPATDKADKLQRYQITVQDNVQVDSGSRWLHDADKLTIKVDATDFKQRMERRSEPNATSSSPTSQSATGATTTSTSASTSAPTSAPVRHQGKPAQTVVTWSGPLEMTPIQDGALDPNDALDTKPDSKRDLEPGGFDFAAEGKPLHIGEAREVMRDSQPVKEESSITCQHLTFRSLDRVGKLWNEDDQPVTVVTGAGQTFSCRQIDFSQDPVAHTGTATLSGAGKMELPVSDNGVSPSLVFDSIGGAKSATTPASTTEPSGENAKRVTTITWTQSVATKFGTLPAAEKDKPGKNYLKEAIFRGDVRIIQPNGSDLKSDLLTVTFAAPKELAKPANESPYSVSSKIDTVLAEGHVKLRQANSADFVEADNVEVAMTALDQDNREPAMPVEADSTTLPATQPSVAGQSTVIATGNVVAQQKNNLIKAQYLKLYFKQSTKEEVVAGAERIVPLRVRAFDNVEISQPEKQVEIQGRWLESDLVNNTATIVGDLAKATETTDDDQAKVTQKDTWIKSKKLVVDMSPVRPGSKVTRQQVDGIGLGSLEFKYVPKGPDGKESGETRVVTINWQKKLLYRGQEDRVQFEGAVALNSQNDQIKCETLEILFEPLPPANPPADRAAAQATTGKSPRLTMMDDSVDMTRRSIKSIHAIENVSVLKEDRDPNNQKLLTSLLINGQKLTFNSEKPTAETLGGRMEIEGAGNMVMQDYRPEKPKDSAAIVKTSNLLTPDSLGPDALVRPSQTIFVWQKGMSLTPDRRVIFKSEVHMEHRSGDNILPVPDIKTGKILPVSDTKTGKGRYTTLDCEELECRFGIDDASAGSPAAKPASDGVFGSDPFAGARVGPLEYFSASGSKEAGGGMVLNDGLGRAQGYRLTYSRNTGMATITGDDVGKTGHLATLDLNDPKQNGHFEAPEVLWDRQNNRVEMHGVRGGGGGR